MSRHTPFANDLPKWLRYREFELAMFYFCRGVQTALPATSDTRSIQLFISVHGLSEDEFPLDSTLVKYSRMKQDFADFKRE